MLKFKRREKIISEEDKGKVVIYYSGSDVFLGGALVFLSIFFANDFLARRTYLNYDSVVHLDQAYAIPYAADISATIPELNP